MTKSNVVTITKDGKKFSGVPYEDFRTFRGWISVGKRVKKGEKTCYQSVSFPKMKDRKTGDVRSYPKTYSLFHISQVA